MNILHALPAEPIDDRPSIVTIGNFDGVHLGHQALIDYIQEKARKKLIKTTVISFSNHPSTVLKPTQPTPLLCTSEHRQKLFEKLKVDTLVLLPFTKAFSELSAEEFLHKIKLAFNLSHLVLGSDAHIGKNREGNQKLIHTLGKSMGFAVDYFPDVLVDGKRVSSTEIRDSIRRGDLTGVSKLLGRPYSIMDRVTKGSGRGSAIGFPTANISVNGLCLPPYGVYRVTLWIDGIAHQSIANLGIAPTVRQDKSPLLEVHMINHQMDLYGKLVEVEFHDYIRPEKKFSNVEELKKQIAIDVDKVKR